MQQMKDNEPLTALGLAMTLKGYVKDRVYHSGCGGTIWFKINHGTTSIYSITDHCCEKCGKSWEL